MSEEDSNDGSEVELTNLDVVIKTAKAKGKNKLEDRERLNQAILPPKYDILNKDLTSQQTTKKFGMHCARFAENKCSAGSMCIFSTICRPVQHSERWVQGVRQHQWCTQE